MVVYRSLNTKFERSVSDARHAVGDGDGGQAAAVKERMVSDARHAVGYSVIRNCSRNGNTTRITWVILAFISYLYGVSG